MQLLVVGAGPAYTDRIGATSSAYLVTAGASRLLLDLGQGSFTRVANVLEPSELTAIVVSHLHPDHFVDLVPLRHYLRYQFDPPRRVRVLAPAALPARLDGLLGEEGFTGSAFDVEPLAPGRHLVGPFAIDAARVRHTDDSYAFRVSAAAEGGSRLVYSGDCGRADDLLPLIKPGDALLAEVSFGPGPVPPDALHLDAPTIARVAVEGRAGRLLLTHLQMGFDPGATVDSARAVYGGDVRLVTEGDAFEI